MCREVLGDYPASSRHGCTPIASRAITMLSVCRLLRHLVQRKRRSFSGTSPLPASMIACKSAGAWWWQALHPDSSAGSER